MQRKFLTTGRTAILAATVVLWWSAASFAGTPTLGSDCGVGAALVGTSSDSAGKLTLGDGATTCTLSFGAPYTNPPACSGMDESSSSPTSVGTRTTAGTLVLSAYATWGSGDSIAYMCLEY